MSEASNLIVKVLDDRDIVVMMPEGFQVTYRGDGYSTMLIATDPLRDDQPSKLAFLVKAWKAAYCKARSGLADLVANPLGGAPAPLPLHNPPPLAGLVVSSSP